MKKLIIEIPDHVYEHAKNMSEDSNDEYTAMRAIADGERPHYGKWIVSEVRCPYCLEYFDTDAYNEGDLEICPCCGQDMERWKEATHD